MTNKNINKLSLANAITKVTRFCLLSLAVIDLVAVGIVFSIKDDNNKDKKNE